MLRLPNYLSSRFSSWATPRPLLSLSPSFDGAHARQSVERHGDEKFGVQSGDAVLLTKFT
jgi:hypothetical protein